MSLKKSHIFISDISSIILYNLLDNIPTINQTDSYYRIDPEIFRQLQYNNHIDYFYNQIQSVYRINKRFYIERDITYKNFLTILRHICRQLDIPYNKQIIYNKSKYAIHYFIDKTPKNYQIMKQKNNEIAI